MARAPIASRISPESLVAVKRLGEALREARVRRKLTQQDLADRVGVARLTIINLEHGDPGVASGLLVEALSVLDPTLLANVLEAIRNDPTGRTLEAARLPKRVRRVDDF